MGRKPPMPAATSIMERITARFCSGSAARSKAIPIQQLRSLRRVHTWRSRIRPSSARPQAVKD